MQANVTQFNYMHTSEDTDTDFQCEGINIKSEDMVKMLGINIDNKKDLLIKKKIMAICFVKKVKLIL